MVVTCVGDAVWEKKHAKSSGTLQCHSSGNWLLSVMRHYQFPEKLVSR